MNMEEEVQYPDRFFRPIKIVRCPESAPISVEKDPVVERFMKALNERTEAE